MVSDAVRTAWRISDDFWGVGGLTNRGINNKPVQNIKNHHSICFGGMYVYQSICQRSLGD